MEMLERIENITLNRFHNIAVNLPVPVDVKGAAEELTRYVESGGRYYTAAEAEEDAEIIDTWARYWRYKVRCYDGRGRIREIYYFHTLPEAEAARRVWIDALMLPTEYRPTIWQQSGGSYDRLPGY